MDAIRLSSNIINEMNMRDISIDHIKLQKLLYFFAVEYYKEIGSIPFTQRIEKWKLGPVIRDVYSAYKINGAKKITSPTTKLEIINGTIAIKEVEPIDLDKSSEDILNKIIDVYGNIDSFELVELTHQAKPWMEAEQDIVKRTADLFYSEDDFKTIVGELTNAR